MSTKLEKTFQIKAEPARVSAAMRDPQLIEESEKSRDAVSVRVEDRLRTEERHEYVIYTTTPARTVTGIDHSKTENNKTEVSWELPRGTGRWTWEGPQGPRAKVTGGYRVEPSGPHARLTLTVEIDIGIPVVGRVVEKKVRDVFEKQWPLYVERIERYAQSA